jgi:MFS transporter, DHA3 family, tetracycline resistance protein
LQPKLKLRPETVYLLLTGLYTFTFSVVLTVAIVYQTQQAGLTPFQLVASGAATQVATFVFEVPTGLLADVKGRRFSVITGMITLGLTFLLMGASTNFWTIFAAQGAMGLGLTFLSGAQEAWIADEVGIDKAGPVFLRSSQTMQFGRLAGIPTGVGLGLISLRLPILLGGAMFGLVALLLWMVMPETGFRPPSRARVGLKQGISDTFGDGVILVRTTPVLLTLFAMAAFYETTGEVFNRLNVAHFLDDIGFPSTGHLEPIVWFGIMRMIASLMAIGLVQYVRHRVDTTDRQALNAWMLRINLLQMASLLVFALTNETYSGMFSSLSATTMNRGFQPLYLALLNMHVQSGVRATVLSMSSQVDSLGQVTVGPILGVVASQTSIRVALVCTALLLLPAIALNVRASGQQDQRVVAAD